MTVIKNIQPGSGTSIVQGARASRRKRLDDPLTLISRNFEEGWLAIEQGRFGEARSMFEDLLSIQPDHFGALQLLGAIELQSNHFEKAFQLLSRALELDREHAETFYNHGIAAQGLRQVEAAIASYDAAVALKHDYLDALYNRGNALAELKRFDDAIASFDRVISIRADYVDAHLSRANAMRSLWRHDDALAGYDLAIALRPDDSLAHLNRGEVLYALGRLEEALDSCDTTVALNPDHFQAHLIRGDLLHALKRLDEALVSYDRAHSLNPDSDCIDGRRLHTKMFMCDWTGFEDERSALVAKIEEHESAEQPFTLAALIDSPALHLKASRIWAQSKYPATPKLGRIRARQKGTKIRLGYFSAEFRDHAVANLMAGFFENQDRTKFELIAFSSGPETDDEVRHRLVPCFDELHDVRTLSDRQVAQRSRALKIDIAVDLNGYTGGDRPGIFAYRAAPIQVSYLGYPGSMGADFMDYLVADKTVIPPTSQDYYSEKIVYLPHCYQVNDDKLECSDVQYRREDMGLPAKGFVFCCFNNNFKITPTTFDGWMRILNAVPDSVLWLFEDNPIASANLRQAAISRGVSDARLVFAKRMPLGDHLPRHFCADLFLDTFPYNAHATASYALRAGLPLLTLAGKSFASRVAASLVTTIGLPELIAQSQEEYESLAIELAGNPAKLARIKQAVVRNSVSSPLFDTPSFTRHLEAAFCTMMVRFQSRLSTDHIDVVP